MPTDSAIAAQRHPFNRCAISNGTAAFLGDVDRRSLQARRHVDLLEMLVAQLGGVENVTTEQIEIARRAAGLGAFFDRCEAAMAREEEIDMQPYFSACNNLRRLLVTLGLERVARDITLSVEEYIERKTAEKASA
jgi:hypothetical protein